MLIANFIISLITCLILVLILIAAYLTSKKGANQNVSNKRAQSEKTFNQFATKKNKRR